MDNSNPLKKPIQQPAPNPLAQYYRKPGTYIDLPSGARFYSTPPALTDTGELAVYPMTAKDELALKNPDALLNGEAIRQVIASVCPDIKNVDEIPAPDIDTILVAMRMTSFGDDMEIDVAHGCEASNGKSQRVTVGLGSILSTSKKIPEDLGAVTLTSGVTVNLRPYTLKAQNKLIRAQFQTMRHLQAAESSDKSIDERAAIADAGYKELTELSQEILADSIISVVIPDGTIVTNKAHILDWVRNLDRASNERLDQELKEFAKYGITRLLNVKCDHCGEDFTSDMLFDPTSFFIDGS